ncbi:MAG: segregation/condensation protein A [Oscillatoriales cyanobacterium C42_A2020_001]|nr:segregation/condensation protein A [Leptolyngbyaceae cyanobacterium C42_A2020_001]
MALSLAEDAIALLIDMAEQGEIDPWDVKVIEVIDRFLSEMPPSINGQEPYEKSLSSSGQAFLYASMLVLLKADSLTQPEPAEETDIDLDEAALLEDGIGRTALPPNLEKQIRRRAVAQPPQRRKVTLKDLIDQLRTIAAALEDPTPRKRLRRPPAQSRSQTVRAIAQLAHQENLSEMATALEQFFADHLSNVHDPQTWLDFEFLLDLWTQSQNNRSNPDVETHSPQHDRVGIFWALLLLSAQSKVELEQDEFYQDLRVRPLNDSANLDAIDGSA